MATAGSINIKLGIVTATFKQDTDAAKTKVKQLEDTLEHLGHNVHAIKEKFHEFGGGLMAGGIGLIELMHKAFETSNEIRDLSMAYDMSADTIIQFRQALMQSGLEAENANRMISMLFSKIDEAKDSNRDAVKIFEDLGISFEELNNSSPDELLKRTLAGLAAIGDTTQRVAEVRKLFGRSGVGAVITELAEQMEKGIPPSKEMADKLKDLGRVNENLKVTMDNLAMAFGDLISVFADAKTGAVSVETLKAAIIGLTGYAIIAGIANLIKIVRELAAAWAFLEGVMLANPVTLALVAASAGIAYVAYGNYANKAAEETYKLHGAIADTRKEAEEFVDQVQKIPRSVGRGGNPAWEAAVRKKQEELAEHGSHETAGSTGGKEPEFITALKSKLELEKQSIGLIDREAAIKIQALSTDKLSSQIKENALARDKAIAAENARWEEEAKKKMTADELGLNTKIHEAKISAIKEQYSKADQLAKATHNKEMDLLQAERNAKQQGYDFDKDAAQLKLDGLHISDDELAVKQQELATKRKIAELEQQMHDNKLKYFGDELTTRNAMLQDEINSAKKVGDIELQTLKDQQKIKKETADLQLALNKQEYQDELEVLDLDLRGLQMRDRDLKIARIRLQVEQQIAKLIAEKEINNKSLKSDDAQRANQDLDEQINKIRKSGDAQYDYIMKQQELQHSFSFGWKEAYKDMEEAAMDNSGEAADIFGAMMSDMGSAISEFTHSGKFEWNKFRDSVIADITAIILKMTIMKLVMASVGLLKGLGGSNMANPTAALEAGGTPESFDLGITDLGTQADGGYFKGASIVGENGPELLVGNRNSASIIPNQQMSNYMNKQPQNIFNGPYIANMSAIDTQSGVQFLAKNKQTIWAANQSAQRSIPSSR